eukprot:12923790-Prorocentrum_lima.AAC.1
MQLPMSSCHLRSQTKSPPARSLPTTVPSAATPPDLTPWAPPCLMDPATDSPPQPLKPDYASGAS